MSSTLADVVTTAVPNVLLRGGPAWLTEDERTCYTVDVEKELKVPTGNAYEHFRPTSETVEHAGARLHVFEWHCRTYVAE